jgi:hypothetical protein
MKPGARHRTVKAISPVVLKGEVAKLKREGWNPIGEPTLAVPVTETSPPYWVQSMYHLPREDSRDSGSAKDSARPQSPESPD